MGMGKGEGRWCEGMDVCEQRSSCLKRSGIVT